MFTRLEPGARKCLLTWTTEGVKTPERTEEQGETGRLKETGEVTEESPTPHQNLSRSSHSERMDSLDEAGVGNKSAEFEGLDLSSDTDDLFKKRPELTSPPRPGAL